MKKEIVKVQKFEIAAFEVLDNSGNQLAKGGFSTAYSGAGPSTLLGAWNWGKQCGCTVTVNNNVAGCGCQMDKTTNQTQTP